MMSPILRSFSCVRTVAGLLVPAALLSGCGGGDATSPPETPTAASVVVTPDSSTVQRDGTVQLSARVLDRNGAALSGRVVAWSTAATTVATVTSTGLVSALTGGRAVITATSEGRSGSAVVIVEAGPRDFDIAEAQFTQGVQAADGSIPLVLAGNGAVLNVLMSAAPSSTLQVPLVLRLYDGGTNDLVWADTLKTKGSLGDAPSYDAPTAQFLVPSSVLRAGLTWQVVRDPGGSVPDDVSENDVYPRSGPGALTTADVPTLDLRFVPVVLTSHNNATGNVATSNLDQYVRVLLSVYPLGRVNLEVGTPLTTSASFGSPPQGGQSGFWVQLLSELDVARVADASGAYWYGVVHPPAGFNYTDYGGWGYIPGNGTATGSGTRTALGVEVGWFNVESQARDLVAHELGHNFGRTHSPCGNPSGVDPSYPVPGGFLDRPGHDAFAWTNGLTSFATTISASTSDAMGYCHPAWASTYTYNGVLTFRAPAAVAPLPVTRVLLARGRVSSDGVYMEPALTLDARPSPADVPGRYLLEGVAADGSVLFTHPFEPAVIDHAPDVRTFAVAVPLGADLEDRLETLRVRGPAGEAVLTRPAMTGPARIPAAPDVTTAGEGMTRVSCDAVTTRGIVVRDAGGGVLGTSAGASAMVIAPSGASLTAGCSDGVRTVSFDVIVP